MDFSEPKDESFVMECSTVTVLEHDYFQILKVTCEVTDDRNDKFGMGIVIESKEYKDRKTIEQVSCLLDIKQAKRFAKVMASFVECYDSESK